MAIVVAREMESGAARTEMEKHNQEHHGGDAVAYVTDDRVSKSSKYMVLCLVCRIEIGESRWEICPGFGKVSLRVD